MTFEIFYKEYEDYFLYPVNNTCYFKIIKGYSDYMEYYLYSGNKTFYATSDHIFPLDIFDNNMQENYISSIHYAEGDLQSKLVYDRFTKERRPIQLLEYSSGYFREVICKKNGSSLFELRETKSFFSNPKMVLKGLIEGHELELFVTFLSFQIEYPDNRA